ncbi:MAG: PDDEXK nuclease domain-containing protein [Nanoarchaeota archaeon]|nr:PDDEXK nuclease domain-containing protein [Nanoarchaeota archaeon]
MKNLAKGKYDKLIGKISKLVIEARTAVVKTINTRIVHTYWTIGKYIVEYEQKGEVRADYGSELMRKISEELSARLGKGFSRSNLQNMRLFYLTYKKSQTLSGKLGWSHYCLLLSISDNRARQFYEKEAINSNWSVRELERQIGSLLYERLCLSRDKKGVFELSKKGQIIEKPKDMIKDPYVLEFLDIPESEKLTEKKIESRIIGHLKAFVLELGKGFLFVSKQYRISMNNEHHYVDLVFYNVYLKCYVLIDLKIRKFKHEDAGQMNFYLNYFKNEVNVEGDNPPVGIILCTGKEDVYVDYVLGGLSNKIFTSKYKLKLPTMKELADEVKKDIQHAKRKLVR